MARQERNSINRISRRDFLFAASVVSGAVVSSTLLVSPALASTKMSPKAMSYRPTPNGNQRCDNCANFQAPGSCKLIDGPVSPSGWCILYNPKK